jgi:regulator of RNase E activity RraA
MAERRDDEAGLTERLERCSAAAVHDVLRAMGQGAFVLPPSLRPLDPARKLAGPAFTVAGHLDGALDPHETLLRWTGLLSAARPGSVVACQPNTSHCALMGELSAEALKRRGVRGYLVDGGCRDIELILALGFPVFCRFAIPVDIVGRWTPDAFDQPITIGDVRIEAGDYLLGDRDGAVRIPRALAAEVIARAEAVMGTESQVRKAILAGMDPQEAYRRYGKF